jgi:hypothetical protein
MRKTAAISSAHTETNTMAILMAAVRAGKFSMMIAPPTIPGWRIPRLKETLSGRNAPIF